MVYSPDVSKSVWTIAVMGMVAFFLVSIAMVLSLTQFKEVPAAEHVKLGELISSEFKAQNVTVRVGVTSPIALKISYLAGIHSNYNTTVQNEEMERVARFALANYKGRDKKYVDEVRVTRTEIHGSGCFQDTYVGTYTLPVSRRAVDLANPGPQVPPPPQER